MKIYVCRKPKKNGEGTYLALEARGEWGNVLLSYDINTILQVVPFGTDHRTLTREGVEIGKIYDTYA